MESYSENGAGASEESSAFHEVGWGKPPKQSRFQPGVSGNPKGRRPGSRNKRPLDKSLAAIVSKVGDSKFLANDGGRQMKLSMIEGILKATAVSALKGNRRAARDFLDLVERLERFAQGKAERKYQAAKAEYDEFVRTFTEYKFHCEKEIQQCRAEGRRASNFFPHPDDIEINIATGAVRVFGPWNKESLAEWQIIRNILKKGEERVKDLTEKLHRARNERTREAILRDIAGIERIGERIRECCEWLILPPCTTQT
ncbi:MAG: hypothetical protein QOE34_1884 [Verrucomicrobiota bacterium]